MNSSKMTNSRTKISCAASLFAVFVCFVGANHDYEIPQPKFKLLKPRGFQISIPDESGIQLFAFHGNLNKRMEKMEVGQFSADTISKQKGKWVYENAKLKVNPGDVIYYWLFVIKNGVGYRLDDGYYEISDVEVYRASKKMHKLRKRSPYHPKYYHSHSYDSDYIPRRFSSYHFGAGTFGHGPSVPLEDSNENNFGHDYGHGYPHHHERGYHTGQHMHYGHGHNHDYGQHHHHWGHHKHNHDCNWDNDKNNDETTTSNESNAEDTNDNSEVVSNEPDPVITSRPATEPEAEIIITSATTTTTDIPRIDIRFGEAKTK